MPTREELLAQVNVHVDKTAAFGLIVDLIDDEARRAVTKRLQAEGKSLMVAIAGQGVVDAEDNLSRCKELHAQAIATTF